MQQRPLSRTGRDVSVIGLGTWQLGPDWGGVSEDEALAVLAASADAGVTLFDTADVYGDGRSEEIIGKFLNDTAATGITVATKMGRREDQVPENYTMENFRGWIDRSRRLLGTDTLDLVQLHCPPSAVIDDDATYDALDQLVAEGVIAAYGASVETMEQALSALRRPNLSNLQIIFNPFRLKPLDEVLPMAAEKNVAVLARVPLASGLLSGKYTADTTFDKDDHRTYNRNGEAFDKGETFSGVPFAEGVAAADELKASLPEGVTLPAATLAWIASREGITSVIPGARSVAQATSNAGAAQLLDEGFDLDAFDALVRDVYDRRLRAEIHPQW
ncbi:MULTISPECIES: aldo/keto reductase [unclassified Microbacterium]|uniref:aldo/keto reductase n=1 Tax=unclassified Microbacterium TaxID=2609290 RepID=UPI00070043A9|nr:MULTISPECIES: aldo/keto reductase [unclassified Microbacterium]KQT71980.1 aldo/keto reductase [Microbacterium sp. Leaf436]MBD8206654.1 aldo/keto reductase [Microbacterium sp. CFBP 8801]MBD8510290.1 aldo/keto reductase [Microbacterium sp. CFBP 8790]